MRRMRHLKPREIQGCDLAFQFWRPETLYDATTGGSLVGAGGSIARAEDVSGNGNHATQATSGDRPTRQVAARNGLDAARFDGSSDYLNAGDAGDILDKPVEMFVSFIRTGSAGLKGIFSKSRAAALNGRWGVINYSGSDAGLIAVSSGDLVSISASTALQLIHLHRETGTNIGAKISRNSGAETTGKTQTDAGSLDIADPVLIGSYGDSSGNPSFANSFLGGDILECAKWSTEMGSHVRKRQQHATMRRARIAS